MKIILKKNININIRRIVTKWRKERQKREKIE